MDYLTLSRTYPTPNTELRIAIVFSTPNQYVVIGVYHIHSSYTAEEVLGTFDTKKEAEDAAPRLSRQWLNA